MTREIRYVDAALQELRSEVAWYREHRTQQTAERFFEEVIDAISRLAVLPHAGPVSPLDARVRALSLRWIRHVVIYQVRDDVILIVAITHMKRRPGYWIERVG